MKRALIGSSALAGVLVIAVAMSPAFATCPGALIEPIQHSLGGYFSDCPEPVRAYAYAIGTGATNAPCTGLGIPLACCSGPGIGTCTDTCTAATCNTAGIAIACTDGTGLNSQSGACQPEAGIPTDGNVTISFDWGGSGSFPGCPNPSQVPNVGRNYLQVVAANGASLFVTVPWSFDLGSFAVDMAEPDTFPAGPISCSFSGSGLSFRSYTGGTLCGNMPVPVPHSECDPGTWGATGGPFLTPICAASNQLPVGRGKLYRKDAACGTAPDPVLSTGAWTNVPIDLLLPENANFNTTGDFCVPVPAPATGLCAYIGATGTINGLETLAMTGNLQIGDQTAPSARALDVRAKAAGGNVVISFRTAGELSLVGFNVLTDAQGAKNRIKVNASIIAPKGIQGGGATYEVSFARGNFKGGKNVYIESVLTTGTLLSDPARF